MIEVKTRELSGTRGNVLVVAGLMATFLNQTAPYQEDSRSKAFAMEYGLSSGTHGGYARLFATRGPAVPDATFELAKVFADLAERQERLGNEFEQVLFENLWDLYAR
jgi:hypothetical protein